MRLRDYFFTPDAEKIEFDTPERVRDSRRVARGFIWIATIQLLFIAGMAISHYGYGEPIYWRHRGETWGQLATEGQIAAIIALFVSGDILFITIGATILRRHRPVP